MANGHGGARAGAGRKPNRDKHKAEVDSAEDLIAAHLNQAVRNLITLANGVKLAEDDDIYVRPPDRAANEYLLNRILGKPTERSEVTGEDGEPLKLAVQVYLPDNGRGHSQAQQPAAGSVPGDAS